MKRTIEIRSIQIYNIDRMDFKKGQFLTLQSTKQAIHCASNKNRGMGRGRGQGLKKGRSILKEECFASNESQTEDLKLMLRKGQG